MLNCNCKFLDYKILCMESEGIPVKSFKELYEKPYSLMLQFQSADFITLSENWDGDVKDASEETDW